MLTYQNKVVQADIQLIISQKKINFEKLRNKTVLITGVSGMLATYLAYTLYYLSDKEAFNIQIIGTARNMAKARQKFEGLSEDYFTLIQHDVTIPFQTNHQIDFIIHAASNASPKFITTDPVGIIKANTIGTLNLLEFAQTQKNRKSPFLIHSRNLWKSN